MMRKITNDQSLHESLNKLTIEDQRLLAARFISCVADLTRNEVLLDAIETAAAPNASSNSRSNAYKNAKSIAIKTYTSCGHDTDWLSQAEHFVAAGCAAALMPEETLSDHVNPAWRAAMQARMARNCAMIEADEIDDGNENERQYELTEEFLAASPKTSAGAQAG